MTKRVTATKHEWREYCVFHAERLLSVSEPGNDIDDNYQQLRAHALERGVMPKDALDAVWEFSQGCPRMMEFLGEAVLSLMTVTESTEWKDGN